MSRTRVSPWYTMLYLVFAVVILVGVAVSVSIETRPMPYVQGMYDAIESLPEGSKVLWAVTGWPFSFYTAKLSSAPVLQHIMEKGLKLVTYGGQGTLVNMHDKIMALGVGYDRIGDHPDYGTQLVDLGIIPGSGAAQILKLIEGFETLTHVDMYGTPLTDLPLTQEFQSAKDADLIFTGGRYIALYRAMDPTVMQVMIASSSTGIVYSTNELYVTGLIEGFVAGIKQGGQYEQLAGTNIGAQTLLLAETIVGAFIVGGMIIANVGWLYNRYVRGRRDEPVVTVTGGADG